MEKEIEQVRRFIANLIRIGIDTEKETRCKFCGSQNLVRYGSYQGVQRYRCNDCMRVFTDNAAIPEMHTPSIQIGAALSGYYRGMSVNQAKEHLKQQYGNVVDGSTIYRWVVRFSKVATEEARKYVPEVGNVWVADETSIKIQGKKRGYWFWDIIDAKTRFLLASHISSSRTTNDAVTLMEKALERAGKFPQIVITDKLQAYLDATGMVFGAKTTKHIQSRGFKVELNTNLIERFHGSLKDRTKVMRGLAKKETAYLLLNGWLVHYNFFRPHEALKGKTPAEKASIKFPYRNWLDVVRHGSYPTHREMNADTRIAIGDISHYCRSPTISTTHKSEVRKARSRRITMPAISQTR